MDQATRLKIGQRVRAYRKVRGLTQAELGKAAGVTLAQISNIETGHTPPSLNTLIGIARALDVPLPEMFDFDEADGCRSEQRARFIALADELDADALAIGIELLTVLAKRQRRAGTGRKVRARPPAR